MHQLQGLFIFVLYVVMHEKVYAKIKCKISNIRKWVSKIYILPYSIVCKYACVC